MMKKWYALKVFYNRFSEIKATLSRDGIESYIPMKTRSYPQPKRTSGWLFLLKAC